MFWEGWSVPPSAECVTAVPPFLPTVPGPVSDFRVTSVGTREVSLAWSSDGSNSSFRLSIIQDGIRLPRENTTDQNITIRGLDPGTNYVFEIVAQGPNGTEADPQNVSCTTGKHVSGDFCPVVMFLKENQHYV